MSQNFTIIAGETSTQIQDETPVLAYLAYMASAPDLDAGIVPLIYQDDPVPGVSGRFGAPMGRMSGKLDPDGDLRAQRIDLEDGYDAGGAYWGCRPVGYSLFAVQDGAGNIAFFDARDTEGALQAARDSLHI